MANRSLKVNLDREATQTVEQIANDLGIGVDEVIRNGVALMNLYRQVRSKDGRIMIEEDGKSRQLIIGKEDEQKIKSEKNWNKTVH